MNDYPTIVSAKYRHAAQSLRGIRARAGRTNATDSATGRHEAAKAAAVAELMDAGLKEFVGLLVEEEKLAERMRVARTLGQDRPELAERLAATRRKLDTATYLLAHPDKEGTA